MMEFFEMRRSKSPSPQSPPLQSDFPGLHWPRSNGKVDRQLSMDKTLKMPENLEESLQDQLRESNVDCSILEQPPDETAADSLLQTLTGPQIDLLLLSAVFKGRSAWVQKIMPHTTHVSHLTQCKSLNALHLAIIGGHIQCAEKIVAADANRKSWLATTYEGFTPLHLAVHNKNLALVNALLAAVGDDESARKSYVDQRSESAPKWTALHIAAMKDQADVVRCLVLNGADTELGLEKCNQTPLHLAALYKSTQAARMLIGRGAALTAATDQGLTALALVTSKVPRALDAVNPMLDARIQVLDDDDHIRSLKVTFARLQKSPSDFSMNLLTCLVTSDQKQFLQHSVCQILLDENWERVRMWFFARLFVCFVMLISVTVYMVAFHGSGCTVPIPNFNYSSIDCNATNKSTPLLQFIGNDHPHYQVLLCFIYNAILPLTYFDIGRKLAGFFSFAKSPSTPTIMRTLCRYVRQFDNYLEWFCLICTLYLFYKNPEDQTDTTNLAAMVILISWANFMILQGQIPWFGVYVEMYMSVLKEFMLLLLAYVCLLIGYSISFYVIFKGDKAFSDPLKAIWKTLAMMTGELEYNDLFPDASDGMGIVSDLAVRLIFVAFLVTIAIVLMNLLVGIVVHDVNEIKSQALVTKLERKVELVDYLSTTSENIKFILRKVWEIIMVVPNYFCANRRKKYQQPATVADFFKVYTLPKDGEFDSEAKKAALKIALVNQEMHTLDAFGDSVDGPMSGQSHDTLENRQRRNNLKIKQLSAELFAATKDNEEIEITLKSRK